MHVNGLANKFSESDESVIEAARACLTPMFPDKPCIVMPVFSSGQGVKQVPGTYAALNSTNLIVTAGGGIMGHPDGPGAGVSALREAWDAALQGVPQANYALTHPALQAAMDSAA
jgi:ribulose-bisphosphate carboxylase large chain